MLKPIDKEKLFDTLLKHVTHIINEKKAKKLEKCQKIKEINQYAEESVRELADLLPFPTLFYKDNELIFVNTTAKKMLEEVQIDSIKQETSFVTQFDITKDKQQKIKLPTLEGISKVYWLYPNGFFMGTEHSFVQTYVFIDFVVSNDN